MTDRLAFVEVDGGRPTGPMVEYVADVARPVGPSDGVWLTGAVYPLSNSPHSGRTLRGFVPGGERTGADRTGAEADGRTWRAVVVGALLVGGLWGVAVAWTLLALVRAM